MPGPPQQPLQRARRVQVAAQVVQVERHDPDAVVVVDERQRASLARHRADRLRVDDGARAVEHAVDHDDGGPLVDRGVVRLQRDREAVLRPQPHDLGAALLLREPHVAVGGEVELGQDHAVAVRPRGPGTTRSSASAIEMFVVIASSSVSHPVRPANVASARHPREDVLHPHVVGRAFRRPRVHVLRQVRCERVETGPSDALIR